MRTDQGLIADIAEKFGWEGRADTWSRHYWLASGGKRYSVDELPSIDACLALLDEDIEKIIHINKYRYEINLYRGGPKPIGIGISAGSHKSLPRAILLAILEVE